jgi:demethylmenaquinone methyltransferase/2-methoxy-6-polyprenyl-1,4-benzoquinol methylase
MFDQIAPRYDLCNRVISLGLDARWRRLAVRSLGLPSGSVVLDLACGTGDLCRELTAAGLVPIGADRSAGMLQAASGLVSAPLLRGDALALGLRTGSLDGVVCGFALRNFASVPPMLAECARVLRPGGALAMLEVDTPASPVMRLGHRVWFGKAVPFLGGLLSDRDAYRYLPRSVAYLPGHDELAAMLRDAGFLAPARKPLTGGIAQLLTAVRA